MKLFSFIAATAFSLDLNGVWVNRDGDLYQFDEEKLFIIGNDNSVQQTTFSTIEVNGISILMFTDRGNRRGGTIDEATETINFGADFGILQRFDEERNGDPTTTETPETTTLFAPSPFADISGEWTAPDGTVYALVENDAGTGVNIFATNDVDGLVSMIQDAAVAFNADGSVTITGNSIAGTTTGPFEMVVASSKNDATINGVAGTIKNDPITTTAASTSAPAGTSTAAPPAASSTTAPAPTTAPPLVTSPAASTTAPGGDTGINPGVGTTTAAPGGTNSTMPGSGSGDGDPHFVIEHDEFDALCFDANPLGADAIELLQDGNVDIVGHLADANFSKQKRVFDAIVFTTSENEISVTSGEFSVDNDVFEIKENMEPMIFSGFKVYVRPQAYFKHQGIEIRFDDGSKYITHEKQHGDKMSLGVEFDIPNVNHASGLLGAALKPNLYVIEDDQIVTDHGEIPLFATSWNHHSFCHFLEEDQLENLIGTPLTAFYRQRADLLEFTQPK
ncbi:Oidioi.mRNA.OKI2018_I69.chr2.g7544.t1.cds [Oikopleura dioica]|uniref:Oidioi.mRNA.OKI2018_I69.chr2.g7544.t1.cds n=1 Tax=Oikopleura dioica TaxID=34765 RepID=A0ABN7TCF7_OIKDI|nr:Oidioi.mRNA.OKI2018_I69.chr2.g7544.t1.cds [Oikopleura dioica]